MRKKALLKEEREILVVNWFQLRLQHDNDSYATCYQVARGLGMSPSSHLANILKGMVENEVLESETLERSGRWAGWGYRLKRGTFQRVPKQKRTIAIKSSHGIEQLEMF